MNMHLVDIFSAIVWSEQQFSANYSVFGYLMDKNILISTEYSQVDVTESIANSFVGCMKFTLSIASLVLTWDKKYRQRRTKLSKFG